MFPYAFSDRLDECRAIPVSPFCLQGQLIRIKQSVGNFINTNQQHVYWRPQVLLLVSRPASSCPLMDFVNDLKKSGLYVIGHVRRGSMDEDPSGLDPLQQLMRLSGLGAMKPNMVVIGFHERAPTETTLVETSLLKDLKFSRIDRAEELNGSCERLTNEEYSSPGLHSAFVCTVRSIAIQIAAFVLPNLRLDHHYIKYSSSLSQSAALEARRGYGWQQERARQTAEITWNGQKKFIDVWPVYMQKPGETGLGWGNRFVIAVAFVFFIPSSPLSLIMRI
uniref:SLC12 domain-containing protein n=1 Tax=Parascaris equorum TaxID=6256 RepID=A0A914RZ02_PAREQ